MTPRSTSSRPVSLRPVSFASFLVLGALAACSSGSTQTPTGAAGASAGTTGAAAGVTGAAGSAGGTQGQAGTPGPTGIAGAGAAGTTAPTGAAGATTDSGAGNDATTTTDGNAGDFPSAGCAPGAIVCDGFEDYPILPNPFDPKGNIYDLIKIGDTVPTWLSYHFHGPPRVDTSKPFAGKQNYHLDTESGHIVAADIIKEAPDGVDLYPAAHYGRVMVWLKGMPPKSAWGMVSESGLVPGSTTETAQYTLGGVNGQLAFMYTQRKRIVKNGVGVTPRRGGDAENGDPAPQIQCTIGATTEALPTGKWMCVEWMMDRAKAELHMWVNGAPQTEVDVVGSAGTCAVGTAPPTWQGPEHFTELDLGWEVYGNDAAPGGSWEAWLDEFAVGTERIGCPANP